MASSGSNRMVASPPETVPANVKEGELGSDPQLDHALELL